MKVKHVVARIRDPKIKSRRSRGYWQCNHSDQLFHRYSKLCTYLPMSPSFGNREIEISSEARLEAESCALAPSSPRSNILLSESIVTPFALSTSRNINAFLVGVFLVLSCRRLEGLEYSPKTVVSVVGA